MLDFLKRLRAMRKLARDGRAQELDRVLQAMNDGASFNGAKGVMLFALASDHRWIEMNMRMNHHRHLSDQLLGVAWARRLDQHIKATRTRDLTELLEKR